MAAQLLNLLQLKPTPVDRQTGERQTKWAKLVKAVSRRFRRAVEEISLEGMAGLLELGSNSGQSFGSRYRLSISSHQWFYELPTSFPSFLAILEAAKTDLGSIAVLDHAMPHPRWSVAIKLPGGG